MKLKDVGLTAPIKPKRVTQKSNLKDRKQIVCLY